MQKLKTFLKSNIAIALGLFLFALGYYFMCACKEYTWVFMSGDSADWLASAKIWFLPQPYGAPIFIMLAKAINLLGGNLAKNMVFYLACLPSAVSVVLVYFATLKVKGSKIIAIICSLVVIGAFPFLAESTVIREHSLAVMFVAAAMLAWTYRKYPLIILFMGLATAVNIIPLYLTAIWAFADLRGHWRDWLKWCWIFLIVGVAPYGLTLYLMGHAPYMWFQTNLSLASINSYLSTTGTVASLSMADFPSRILDFVAVILVSYGIALIPAVRGFKPQWKVGFFAVAVFWVYLLDNDATTWTFTMYAVPAMALLIAAGLKYKKEIIAVGICALILISTNAIFLNAQTINDKNPMGRELYNSTMALPDGSIVITNQGGFVTLNMFYAISQGKDIQLDFATPIISYISSGASAQYVSDIPGYMQPAYKDWLKWANSQGLEGDNSVDIARHAIEDGVSVFRVNTYLVERDEDAYTLRPYNEYFDEVVAVNED